MAGIRNSDACPDIGAPVSAIVDWLTVNLGPLFHLIWEKSMRTQHAKSFVVLHTEAAA